MASPAPPPADGDSRDRVRHRHVRVGRRGVRARPAGAAHGRTEPAARTMSDVSGVRPAGRSPDENDLCGHPGRVAPARVLGGHRRIDGLAHAHVERGQRAGLLGPQVHFHPRLERNRVHRRAAADAAHVEGGLGRGRHLEGRNRRHGPAEGMERIGHAERAVAVSTRPREGHPIPPASHATIGDLEASAVDRDETIDRRADPGARTGASRHGGLRAPLLRPSRRT